MDPVSYLDSLENLGVEPSLDAIIELCARLGDPQRKYRVIQVTGTNGKTTTSRAIAAIMASQGVECGLYTSPHLVRYNERFAIGGKNIDDDELGELLSGMRKAIDETNSALAPRALTQFEILTAMALLYFAQRAVDVAVLEVGMGARWDATSAARADIGVITGIDLDHTDYLGTSVEQIASEKAYVVREGGKVVTGNLPPAALSVVEERVGLERAEHYRLGEDFSYSGDRDGFSVDGLYGTYDDLAVTLLGIFQMANMAVAVVAAEAALGSGLKEGPLRSALKGLRSPGRMEVVSQRPIVVLDGAHNPQGASALIDALDTEFPGKRPVFVLSMLRDKDAGAFLASLSPRAEAIVATTNRNPRALSATELAELVGRTFEGLCTTDFDIRSAVERGRALAGPRGLVCVTGSLYGVGEAVRWLGSTSSLGPRGGL